MTSCDKAAIICNKAQYGEASFVDKLKLQFHILICKTCATFTKKNSALTSLCEKANLKSLSEEDKLKMKQQLQENQ